MTGSFRYAATALVLGAGLLGGCASDDARPPGDFTDSSEYRTGDYTSGDYGDPEPRATRPRRTSAAPAGTVVSVSPAEHAKLKDFVNRRSTLLADTVEVDLSRKPFLAATVFTASPDAASEWGGVKRTDQVDGTRGLTTITLTNTTGIRTSLHALPKVRIGDGLDIIAVDRIVLRYRTRQTLDRPIYFRGVGTGSAAYLVEGPPAERHKGSRVTLNADVTGGGSDYRFAKSVETQP